MNTNENAQHGATLTDEQIESLIRVSESDLRIRTSDTLAALYELRELRARVADLEDGLKFYANPNAWPTPADRDQGEIARITLDGDA